MVVGIQLMRLTKTGDEETMGKYRFTCSATINARDTTEAFSRIRQMLQDAECTHPHIEIDGETEVQT